MIKNVSPRAFFDGRKERKDSWIELTFIGVILTSWYKEVKNDNRKMFYIENCYYRIIYDLDIKKVLKIKMMPNALLTKMVTSTKFVY